MWAFSSRDHFGGLDGLKLTRKDPEAASTTQLMATTKQSTRALRRVESFILGMWDNWSILKWDRRGEIVSGLMGLMGLRAGVAPCEKIFFLRQP
jgi:hypothetical protein